MHVSHEGFELIDAFFSTERKAGGTRGKRKGTREEERKSRRRGKEESTVFYIII